MNPIKPIIAFLIAIAIDILLCTILFPVIQTIPQPMRIIVLSILGYFTGLLCILIIDELIDD